MNEELEKQTNVPEYTVFGINQGNGNIIIQKGYSMLEINKKDAEVLKVVLNKLLCNNKE